VQIKFVCTCGKRLHAEERYAGRRAKCPACGSVLAIPHADAAQGVDGGHERASDMPATCGADRHAWVVNMDEWQKWRDADATFSHNWPACTKCAMPFLKFIDALDVAREHRIRSSNFQSLMDKRHRLVLESLIRESPPECMVGWDRPMHDWLSLDDPDRVLTIPGGLAPTIWPLLRMVGWKFWWLGGADRMRRSYGDGHGFALDMLWSEIGLGGDIWLG